MLPCDEDRGVEQRPAHGSSMTGSRSGARSSSKPGSAGARRNTSSISDPDTHAGRTGRGRSSAIGRRLTVTCSDSPRSTRRSTSLPKVRSVFFGQPSNDRFTAEVRVDNASGQLDIVFSQIFKAESPFLFVGIWVHEPLHQDSPDANYEEAVNYSFEEIMYLRQLARHPSLGSLGTRLARANHTKALVRLNSGVGSTLGLYATNGNRPLLPGSSSPEVTSWGVAHLNGSTVTTPGNDVLAGYLANTHETGAPACSAATFNKALLDCIDQNRNAGLSTDELLAAARALKLDLDSDGDGVFDSRDACPAVAAVTANGCPVQPQDPGGGGGAGGDPTPTQPQSSPAQPTHKSGSCSKLRGRSGRPV
jgi:hypothetical protein